MPEVNFYLKKAPEKTKENPHPKSLIYLQFKYRGNRLVFSFGESIEPKYWNPEKQRVKSNRITTKSGEYSLNETMDKLSEVLLHAYRTELVNGVPSTDKLKRYLVNFLNQNTSDENKPTLYKLIQRFIDGEIKHKGRDKSPATLTKYGTALKHLQDFEAKTRYKVDFDTITLDFFYKYVSYLKGQGLGTNSISKMVDLVKVFMNEAFDLKYTSNVEHKSRKFSVATQETESIYLTDKELLKLYKHDFSDDKKLDQVRDLFLFGAYVGLRFSDYSTVKPENIQQVTNEDGSKEYFVKMKTTKTGELVVIPCNNIVLQIFEKYRENKNRLPKSISNQKFNSYVKDACKEAKLNERGRLSSNPELELWQCVSSHTARRSFATNLYLEGFPVIDLMKITGHKTERSFLKYIKVSKLDAAKRLSDHMRKQWSSKLLKVA
jgi:integrase